LAQNVGRGVQGSGVVAGERAVESPGQAGLTFVVATATGVGEGDQDGSLVGCGTPASDVAGRGQTVDQLGGGGAGGRGEPADRQRAPPRPAPAERGRGIVALSIEGPGQGESRANGLTVDLTNYDITCPVLYGIGEFDELTALEQALASYERVRAPKELRVYEKEFHPLGGTAAEVFRFGAEWVERALNGEFAEPGRDVRHYVRSDGRTTDGTADPTWWLGAVPTEISDARQA
jgi:hypothetical protein